MDDLYALSGSGNTPQEWGNLGNSSKYDFKKNWNKLNLKKPGIN